LSAASSRDKRPERHAALAALLDAEAIDALLVTSRPNIRYLTGFSGSAGVVVATRTTQLLVTDFRYDEQARQQSGAVARVEIEGTSVWDRLFKELPDRDERDAQPDRLRGARHHGEGSRTLLDGPGARGVGRGSANWFERLRGSQDAGEVAAIRAVRQQWRRAAARHARRGAADRRSWRSRACSRARCGGIGSEGASVSVDRRQWAAAARCRTRTPARAR